MSSQPASYGEVALAIDGGIATLTLRRPAKLNALTPEMLDALAAHLATIAASDARVVVLRGEGTKAFCVGADIGQFADLTPVQMLDWTSRGHRVFDALAALRQPERLTELVGRARAKDIVLARRTIDGATAESWGVATCCVSADALEDTVADLAGRIAAGAPVAVALAKQIIDAAADGAPSRVLEHLAGAVTTATEDLQTGIDGFRTGTTPQFTGR